MKKHDKNKERAIKIKFSDQTAIDGDDKIVFRHSDNYGKKPPEPFGQDRFMQKYENFEVGVPYEVYDGKLMASVVVKKNPQEHLLWYYINIPKFDEATSAVIEEVKVQLLKKININNQEALNLKLAEQLKEKFMTTAKQILSQNIPDLSDTELERIATHIAQHMLGMGDIEFLLRDNMIEEICVNGPGLPIWVYHRMVGWVKTNMVIKSDNLIWNFASAIARGVGRQINTNQPLLDAYLATGDRVNATLFPISYFGNTITIRKFARKPWTITDYIGSKTISSEVAALLWEAIQYEINIIISGGTGAGKTSLLNVLTMFIPNNQRIVSIEQTREITLPSYLQWVPLIVREETSEGTGKITMLDLMVNSLRMRPDRIIVGEIRRADEAEVLFEAMHTGHSVYATLHAETVSETINRLASPPINIPSLLLQSLHLIVAMYRDRKRNIRRVFEVGEVVGSDDQTVRGNIIYRWRPMKDELLPFEPSIRLLELIKMYANIDDDAIKAELAEKKKILDWMAAKKINSIEDVGNIISMYYGDPEEVMKLIKLDKVPIKPNE